MSPIVASLLAAALLAADPAGAPAPAPASARAEAALMKCWARETAACTALEKDGAALEACKADRAKTACATERTAYERELAAGLASDALELLAASVKKVCAAESAAPLGGKLSADAERALADGWRQALEVRSEYMRACEGSGREARDCDDTANEAERRARAESCPTGR